LTNLKKENVTMSFARWLSQRLDLSGSATNRSKSRSDRAGRQVALRLEVLEDRLLPSLTPHLLKDINPGAGSSESVNQFQFTNVSGTAFFVANNGVSGTELWKSNGSAAGTVLVKDIRPGQLGSYPTQLTNVNGALFFTAYDGIHPQTNLDRGIAVPSH
jgi:ELWxxDGT repeat protein